MKQTNEIDAVELVRRIRDVQAEQLAGKSAAEVMEFFNRVGGRSRKLVQRRTGSKTRGGTNKASQRSAEKRRRR